MNMAQTIADNPLGRGLVGAAVPMYAMSNTTGATYMAASSVG